MWGRSQNWFLHFRSRLKYLLGVWPWQPWALNIELLNVWIQHNLRLLLLSFKDIDIWLLLLGFEVWVVYFIFYNDRYYSSKIIFFYLGCYIYLLDFRLIDWDEAVIRVRLLFIIVNRHLIASQLLLVVAYLYLAFLIQSLELLNNIILLLQFFLFCNKLVYNVTILIFI